MSVITSIGEILIDLTQTGTTPEGIPEYAAYPGGAPANLAVAAARLGADVSFVGKVGQDRFGELLRSSLEDNGVDASCLYVDPKESTTLTVVSLAEGTRERSFTFYRSPGADSCLTQEETVAGLAASHPRIMHFGSVSLTCDPAQSALLVAAATARRMGALVSFDPNYREQLWPSMADGVYRIKQALPLCDILKISEGELRIITGTGDWEKGAEQLASYGIILVLITLGKNGVFYRYRGKTGHVPGHPCQVKDTNGAGDAFFGAFLSQISNIDLSTPMSIPTLERVLDFSNRAASIAVSRSGAIPSLPSLAEVEALE